jgi:glycolate oxidase FAD binding subunit
VAPSLVVSPSTQAEVAAVLAVADELGAAVLPRGGGTQTGIGARPERYDIALDLRRIDAVVEHEPADLTITVEAGRRLSDVQRLLGESGQWLPLDPALLDEATIGGILATNASGPARVRYGSPRDLVIGMTVALANGELVKSGGRVVKNVAGYDMAKLHIGAFGTLGVITQASFKVAPLPVANAFIRISGSLEALAGLSLKVIDAGLPVLGLTLSNLDAGSGWALTARFAGGSAAVERSRRETNALASDAGLSLEDIDSATWAASSAVSGPLRVRVTVRSTDLADICGAIAAARGRVVGMPGVGVAQAAWDASPGVVALQDLRRRCESSGGALVFEQASSELKSELDVWGDARGAFGLMRQLKEQFDPHRVLNPGRFVGGL